jgi:chromosomal replication initiation ATPase DnaA
VVDEVKESDLRFSRGGYFNETRNVGIYLLRHLRNDSLREVEEVFKIYKYSTVSSIVERVKQGMGRNKKVKKRIEELSNNISKSQRQTP